MSTFPPATATAGELVAWSVGCLNDRDVAALRGVWPDATVERFPDRTCRGIDEIAAYFEGVFAALPDFRMDVVTIVEDGEDVFLQWRITGTHGGPFQGIEATGRRLEIEG